MFQKKTDPYLSSACFTFIFTFPTKNVNKGIFSWGGGGGGSLFKGITRLYFIFFDKLQNRH